MALVCLRPKPATLLSFQKFIGLRGTVTASFLMSSCVRCVHPRVWPEDPKEWVLACGSWDRIQFTRHGSNGSPCWAVLSDPMTSLSVFL